MTMTPNEDKVVSACATGLIITIVLCVIITLIALFARFISWIA